MKFTRQKYSIAECRGTALTKGANYTVTSDDIVKEGYSFFIVQGAFTLTLPAAAAELKGVKVLVHCNNASGKVAVVDGFGGGGGSYDTVTPGAYGSMEFWCNGSYWYAISDAVGAS